MYEYLIGGTVSIGVYVVGKLIVNGITNGRKKPNGYVTKEHCNDNVNRMTNTVEDLKTTVVGGFKDAKNERKTLFDRVHEVRDDVSDLREKVGVLRGRTEE